MRYQWFSERASLGADGRVQTKSIGYNCSATILSQALRNWREGRQEGGPAFLASGRHRYVSRSTHGSQPARALPSTSSSISLKRARTLAEPLGMSVCVMSASLTYSSGSGRTAFGHSGQPHACWWWERFSAGDTRLLYSRCAEGSGMASRAYASNDGHCPHTRMFLTGTSSNLNCMVLPDCHEFAPCTSCGSGISSRFFLSEV